MLKIKPSAKLPIETFLNKGSYIQRLEYAQELNSKLYNMLQKQAVNGTIHRTDFLANIKKLLPENIKIIFATYTKTLLGNDDAYVTPLTNSLDIVEGMIIRIPSRKKENYSRVIDNRDLSITMHETFHLFASLANPKHTTRIHFNNNENKFYNRYIYSKTYSKFNLKEKLRWKQKLTDFLKDKKVENKINFLQNCRYRLIEENLAYKEGEKYGNKNYMSKYFYFEEKIKIIEKQLYKTIQEARKDHSRKQVKYESK